MQVPRHSFFRDKALKYYTQGRKKDILPNFSSIPAAVFFWLLVSLLGVTGVLAFTAQVPVYLNAPGFVLSEAGPQQTGPVGLVFFQPGEGHELRVGQSVSIQVGNAGPQVSSSLLEVMPGTTTVTSALAHYGQKVAASMPDNQPVVAALVRLGSNFPAALYTGSTLTLKVEVGTHSLFSTLTDL